jgi:hypothetical protein
MGYKLRKGTRVVVTRDIREDGSATGMKGKFVGDEDHEAWILCAEDGKPERESYELPDGYEAWDPRSDPFPYKKCGIRSKNPRFLLEDGTYIHGGQCVWEPVNPVVKDKMSVEMRELARKMGLSDIEIQEMDRQAER